MFGGNQLTCTDIAVAAGLADIGDRSRVAHLSAATVKGALARIHEAIAEASDRMKSDARDVPLIAVGGGSVLIPDRVAGFSEVARVANHAVANAVGAAIAQVSGEVDQIFTNLGREELLEQARKIAVGRAVRWRRRGYRHGDRAGGHSAGLPAGQRRPGAGAGGGRDRRPRRLNRAGLRHRTIAVPGLLPDSLRFSGRRRASAAGFCPSARACVMPSLGANGRGGVFSRPPCRRARRAPHAGSP